MATTDSNGIVFLEETDPISPFHTTINALQQGTSDIIAEIKPAVEDTGWVNVPVASGWTVNNTLQVRRIGAVVYWRGRVTPDASVSGTQTIVAAGGVPSWARPSSVFDAMRPCSSSHTSSVAENRVKVAAVNGDGSVTAWYGASNSDQITLAGLSGYLVG